MPMPLPLKHLAATLLYAVPSIGLAYGLIHFFGFDPKLAALGGLIAALLGAEAHAAISRTIERKAVRKELQELTSLAAGLSRDLDDAADKIVELEERFERETTERMERIFSEIRVIESLVKRLAETREFTTAISKPAVAEIAAPVETVAVLPAADSDVPPPKPEKRLEHMNDSELLETIRRSLETNRVDLYLQPVVSLPQRKTLYYEGLSRLRTDKGELIMPRDYMRVAEPAGMMPTVDNILLFRCIQVVRKLAQRNSKAGVFCNISAFSLLDEDFFPQFIEYMQHNTDLVQPDDGERRGPGGTREPRGAGRARLPLLDGSGDQSALRRGLAARPQLPLCEGVGGDHAGGHLCGGRHSRRRPQGTSAAQRHPAHRRQGRA
jgi:cyclic-di-GMP phosphodiesterase TipF (flagellum assembly factor)